MVAQILETLTSTWKISVEFPGFWLCPGPALSVADIWGIKHYIEDLCLPLPFTLESTK